MSTLALSLSVSLLPAKARKNLDFWRGLIEPLLGTQKGIGKKIEQVSKRTGISPVTIRKKYDLARTGGIIAVVDSRLAGARFWNTKKQVVVSEADRQLVKLYCGQNQRSTQSALKAMRADWVRKKITTETPVDPHTRMPRGWSVRNLRNYAPTKFELKAVRIGRSAAKSERPLVYTTRQGLWVGSHYMIDDMWHDHFVNSFAERQAGRPLELFSHDLFSARKVRWGVRVRTRRDDGSYNALGERMTRMILAATLHLDGYSGRGTVIVAEHGTAAVREDVERAMHEASDGKITISRSGMEGAVTHAGMYPGLARGNFRHKASLESSNNLTHNVFAALPGQTGKDVEHRPEALAGLLKNNQDLLSARWQLSPARAEMLQFALLELNQFMGIAHELYGMIENDPDHDLNNWIECGHVVNELLLGDQWVNQAAVLRDPAQAQLALALIEAGQIETRPRKMTRREVWDRGAGELVRFPGFGVCAILGDDLAVERPVRKNMFEFEDAEVAPGVLRFDAVATTPHGDLLRLKDGERFETFVNPFAPQTLFVRRADGSYIGECARIEAPCRADVEAVQRACGAAARREGDLLAPVRLRHLAEAREKAGRQGRNADVLSGKPITPEEKAQARADKSRVVPMSDFLPTVEEMDAFEAGITSANKTPAAENGEGFRTGKTPGSQETPTTKTRVVDGSAFL